jgi:glycosyltransferase involved in cell wall biosynthesis
MRIAFYNLTAGFATGGLETYCWEMGRELARRGHRVSIVGGNGGAARYPEIELVRFPYTPRQHFPNFGTRFRKLAERLSFARQALPHLLDENYDAIIVNKPYDFPALWRARRRGLRAQTLYRSGGTDFYAGDRWFTGAVDYWVSSSRYNAAQVERHFHRPVNVFHNGVDIDRFVPRARDPGARTAHNLPVAAVVIASVGRLVGWKGLHVIIKALAGLPERVHYLVVGDGAEAPSLKRLAAEQGVADRVHFCGAVPHGGLPELLHLADLYVQPSVGEEAFGISVVEAMACGLPVLVSDQGGLREIVIDGEVGRLLPAGDIGAWHAALAQLVADPALCRRFGEAGRRRAEAEFTWTANALKHEALLSGGRR